MSSGTGEGANSSQPQYQAKVETPAGGEKRPYYKEYRGRGGYRKDYQPRSEYQPRGEYQHKSQEVTEGGAEANYNFDAVYNTENGGQYERRYSRGGYRGSRGGF